MANTTQQTAIAASKPPAKSASARGIQSIMIGGRLLQALIDAARPMSLRDLAAYADITPAQAHAYLVSHKRTGMVVQEFESGPYLLGPLALKLGLGRLYNLPVYQTAGQALKTLSQKLDVLSVLCVWTSGGPAVASAVHPRDRRSDLNIRMGTRFSVLNTSTGRVFGAFETPERVEPRIAAEMDHTSMPYFHSDVADKAQFQRYIAQIRTCGYATLESGRVPDIDAISMPIFDMSETSFAGVITCIGHRSIFDTAPQGAAMAEMREILAPFGTTRFPVPQ